MTIDFHIANVERRKYWEAGDFACGFVDSAAAGASKDPPLAICWLPIRFLRLAVLLQPLQQAEPPPPGSNICCLLQGLVKKPTAVFSDNNVKTTKRVNVDLITANL